MLLRGGEGRVPESTRRQSEEDAHALACALVRDLGLVLLDRFVEPDVERVRRVLAQNEGVEARPHFGEEALRIGVNPRPDVVGVGGKTRPGLFK